MTPDAYLKLKGLSYGLGYSCELCPQLEISGFVETGRSRFGAWARITEAGRAFLASYPLPVSDAGADCSTQLDTPTEARSLGRIASPRSKGNGVIAISSPVMALPVESTPIQKSGAEASKAGIGVLGTTPVRPQPLTMKQLVDNVTVMVIQNVTNHRRARSRKPK